VIAGWDTPAAYISSPFSANGSRRRGDRLLYSCAC
jgi:hypothetical protein